MGITDGSGVLTTTIRSELTGTARLKAYDLSDNKWLGVSGIVVFTDEIGSPHYELPNDGPISLIDIFSLLPLDGRYFEGLQATSKIIATIDWKGTTPNRLEYVINGEVHKIYSSEPYVEFDLNMADNRLYLKSLECCHRRPLFRSALVIWPR